MMGLFSLYLVQFKQFFDLEVDMCVIGVVDLLEQVKIIVLLVEVLIGCVFVVVLFVWQWDLGLEIGQLWEIVVCLLVEVEYGNVVLVFGNEIVGLSNEEILYCQVVVIILINFVFSLFNLGFVVQVFCYECCMVVFFEKFLVVGQGVMLFVLLIVSFDEVEGLFGYFELLMIDIGFFNLVQFGCLLFKL